MTAPFDADRPAGPTQPGPSPEGVAAFEEGERLVREALSSGTWGEPQIEKMRELKTKLTTEQVAAIAHHLFPAINSQQVQLQSRSAPF